MNLFKSGAEKLSARLAELEAQVETQTKRAEDARAEADAAQARLVEDLAEGLGVEKWQRAREAAERKAADAERDRKAAEDAAELVRGKLVEVREAEHLEGLRRRYAAAEARLPAVREQLIAAGRAFSDALARHEALRREEASLHFQLRSAGDREVQLFGVGHPETILSDALGHESGRERFQLDVPIWPDKAA